MCVHISIYIGYISAETFIFVYEIYCQRFYWNIDMRLLGKMYMVCDSKLNLMRFQYYILNSNFPVIRRESSELNVRPLYFPLLLPSPISFSKFSSIKSLFLNDLVLQNLVLPNIVTQSLVLLKSSTSRKSKSSKYSTSEF